jgi:hypothetical protein
MHKIKILGSEFTILFKKLPKDTLGQTVVVDRLICIKPGLKPDVERDIIGHEIIHVILELNGLSGFLPSRKEEALCDALGRAFMIILEENK